MPFFIIFEVQNYKLIYIFFWKLINILYLSFVNIYFSIDNIIKVTVHRLLKKYFRMSFSFFS